MLDFSLTLVLQIKSSKIINDMAKVSIKSEKITLFGGIFHVRELYSRYVGPFIDKVLGLRWRIAGQSPDPPVKMANYIFFAQFSTLLSVKSTSKGWIFCIFAAETNAKRQIDDEN